MKTQTFFQILCAIVIIAILTMVVAMSNAKPKQEEPKHMPPTEKNYTPIPVNTDEGKG